MSLTWRPSASGCDTFMAGALLGALGGAVAASGIYFGSPLVLSFRRASPPHAGSRTPASVAE